MLISVTFFNRKHFPNFVEYRKHMKSEHHHIATDDSTDAIAGDCFKDSCGIKTETFEEHLSETEESVDDPSEAKREANVDGNSERFTRVR